MARKLSQQWVADRVGVSKVTISDLERGEMRLDVEYMKRIAAALSAPSFEPVTPADLLPHIAHPWALNQNERDLIERYRMSPPETQEQVHRVAEALMPYSTQKRQVT
jgi:transcriptional regulator with XRE-family HTH domain